jgi:hypothetical protein
MQMDILLALGARDIRMIEAPEIAKMVKGIQDRGTIDIAKRALETTGQIFRYGIAFGFTKRNPASEIKPRDVLIDFTKPGAQDYINSIINLYASWGIDFIKLDSVTPGSYNDNLNINTSLMFRHIPRQLSSATAPSGLPSRGRSMRTT